MKNLSKSEKMLIGILIAAALGYVYYQYLIMPLFNKIQISQSNIENYRNELSELKLLALSNKKLETSLTELKLKVDESIKGIPQSERTPEIQRDTKRYADSSKVALNSLILGAKTEYSSIIDANSTKNTDNKNQSNDKSQDTKAKASKVKSMMIPVSINVNGDYNSIMNFVKAFENGTRLNQIDMLTVIPKSTKPGDNQLSATIVSSFFYLDDGQLKKNDYDFNNGNYSKDNPFK